MLSFNETKEQTLSRLNVDASNGLNSGEIEQRREKYGVNEFSRGKSLTYFDRIIDALKEPMNIMLIAAAVIATGVNVTLSVTGGEADFLECVGIFAAILLSVVITVVMEGKSAKAFEELNKIGSDIKVKVLRNGKTEIIAQGDIVVGDIVILETGNKIPADGRLLESVSLQVDESSLTGESANVEKDENLLCDEKTPVAERKNMLYSGCFVTSGNGKMVVTDVGDKTEFGKIAKELSNDEKSSTPLQEKLAKLGKIIAVLGVAAAAVVFVIQVIEFIAAGNASLSNLTQAFITSIVLIVAAVPEGLPTTVAIALSINIIKMSKQNALVKKMVASETIGCINVICSDKTGTLTENRMTVKSVYENGSVKAPDQIKSGHIINNFCVNSTADVEFGEQIKFLGNPTECALLTAAHKSGIDYKDCRSNFNILHVFPFSSETKNMTTVAEKDGKVYVFTKGSPEKILAMCPKAPADEINRNVVDFQEKACRVIGFAHKQITPLDDYENAREALESEMEYDGFTAIADPLRAEVFDAVNKCRSAGIDLKMLTGDNIVTAKAIAEELGILDDEHIAVEAGELENLSDKELKKIVPKIRVIARSTPIVKMRVVKALKELHNVVAVTGDGINDAPAIKNADVGIAMGITGTEVSKEASDIVLLDDSFATIVKAVHWGRGIYENFKRFIQFQLTVNLSSVLVVLTSIIAGMAAPFTALQLLWVNIIMDGPPALTLGLEPIHDDLMLRKPTARNAGIVTKGMFSRIFINGLYISFVFLLQSFTNFMGAAEAEKSTVLFTLFVVFQLFNAFNSRELTNKSVFRNIGGNGLMAAVFAVTFALQVLITQFGGQLFKTVPLGFEMWVKIVLTAFTVILLSELVKLIKFIFSKIKAK